MRNNILDVIDDVVYQTLRTVHIQFIIPDLVTELLISSLEFLVFAPLPQPDGVDGRRLQDVVFELVQAA